MIAAADSETAEPRRLSGHMVAFVRRLRDHGIQCGVRAPLDGLRALRRTGLGRRGDVKAALRTVCVQRAADGPVFDRLFDRYWGGRPGQETTAVVEEAGEPEESEEDAAPPDPAEGQRQVPAADEGDDSGESRPVDTVVYMRDEVLRRRDFGEMDTADLAAMERIVQRLARRLATRRSRRRRRTVRGPEFDLRGTLRRMLRTGGEPIELARRRRRLQKSRLAVLCDVSGSMDSYARFLLLFCYALQQAQRTRVETFTFSTRLERVTPKLRDSSAARALDRAVAAGSWGSGTRIGESLMDFCRGHGRRCLQPHSVVLILSDGLDRGDTELIEESMDRIAGTVRRVIWLNPLAGDDRYEPLTRGMQAALPHIDVLAPAHNLESLAALERYL